MFLCLCLLSAWLCLFCFCYWWCICKPSFILPRCLNFPKCHYTMLTHSLWHYNFIYRFQEYGLYVKLWWKYCFWLSMVVFWTKIRYISCFQMPCNLCQDIWEELTFQTILDNFVEEDFFYHQLKELVVCMKWKIMEVLHFMSFLHAYERKRGHNMLALMFNPRCKSTWGWLLLF